MNFGFLKGLTDPTHYFYGTLPKNILQEDGNWTTYVPTYEPQYNSHYDTYGCTVWGTQNAIETLLKRLTGKNYNYSERFTYILADVKPPGSDPQTIAECVREHGLIDESFLPMTDSYEEFLVPKPMELKYLIEGMKWPWEFKHEWLWDKAPDLATRNAILTEALRYSPIGLSVTAWYKEGDLYVDKGQENNHWCVLVNKTLQGWVVFDSYDQSLKTLSFNHNFERAKRYSLKLKDNVVWYKTFPILKQLSDILDALLTIKKKMSNNEKLCNLAKSKIGTDFTNDQIVSDEFSCAFAVSTLLHELNPQIPIMESTTELDKFMATSSLFRRVPQPIDKMQGGWIEIAPTGSNSRPDIMPHGHVGIYQDSVTLMSNSSISGLWEPNYTRETFRQRYGIKGGFPLRVYELLG